MIDAIDAGRAIDPPTLRRRRALWTALAVLARVPLVIAAGLSPSPNGYGTHLQLGMSPCAFLAATGRRCPACGMTTAFAHMIRGQVTDALHANALGALLFLGDVAGAAAAVAAAVMGASVAEAIHVVRRSHLIELMALAVLTWTALWFDGWILAP
jgi:hypothetical protein